MPGIPPSRYQGLAGSRRDVIFRVIDSAEGVCQQLSEHPEVFTEDERKALFATVEHGLKQIREYIKGVG